MNVGDPVIVVRPSYSYGRDARITEHTIESVKRLYFYVQVESWGGPTAFEIGSGRERIRSNQVGTYAAHAYTPDGWADKQRRDAAEEKCREFTRSSCHSLHAYTTDQLERIAAILQES